MIEYKTETFVATAYLYIQLGRLWSEQTKLFFSFPLVEILLILIANLIKPKNTKILSYDDTLDSLYPGNVLPDGEEPPTKLR